MGCPCYWGCRTCGNKIMWGIIAAVATCGIVFAVAGGIAGRACFSDYQDCMDARNDSQFCYDRHNARCNLGRYWGVLFTGIILFIVVAPLLMSYFCCCATNPYKQQAAGAYPVVQPAVPMTAVPHYPQQPYPAAHQGDGVAYVNHAAQLGKPMVSYQ